MKPKGHPMVRYRALNLLVSAVVAIAVTVPFMMHMNQRNVDATTQLNTQFTDRLTGSVTTRLATIRSDYESLKPHLDQLSTNDGVSNENVEAVLARMRSLMESIGKLAVAADTNHKLIADLTSITSSLNGKIDGLEERMITAEGDGKYAVGAIAGIQTELEKLLNESLSGDMRGRIPTLEDEAKAAKSRMDAIEKRVEVVERRFRED